MKTLTTRITTLLTASFIAATASADTIALWNFNSLAGDFNPATGTLLETNGVLTATILSPVTNSFGTVASAGASDPDTVDDSELRLANFPAQGTANKSAGIQFNFSTVGYENIVVVWDHYNSATASRYYRVQYTADGSTWLDHNLITNSTQTTWINQTFTSDFSGVPAANNNANFGVRLVTEFAPGTSAYTAVNTGSSYGPGGTLWLDMIIVSGSILTGNSSPSISAINDLTTRVDVATSPIAFTVSDPETSAANLTLSLISSDPTLVNANYVFGGSAGNRTVAITPEPGQTGAADITIRVTDEGGKFADSTFTLTVLPANTAPTITTFARQVLTVNGATTNIAFTVGDLESAPGALTLAAYTPNTTLLPPAGVIFGGTGANRTVQLTPAANEGGATWVTIVVSDGSLSASNSFMLKVLRPNIITYWDFNSNPPDNNTSTGTLTPAIGSGTATSVGTATNSLNSNVAPVSFDPTPNTSDNSKWRFGSFPSQSTSNKTSGAEFRLSTVGYENITVTWDHYNSATGNRYWRLQYTLDGVNFIDSNFVYTNPVEVTWFPTGTSLASIPGANNNANFGVRIVAEFENTANGGATTNDYVATQATGNYSSNGTLWMDTVTFSGDLAAVRPTLAITRSGDNVRVSWSTNATDFDLLSTTSLSPASWGPAGGTLTLEGDQNVVTLPATNTQFFRLEK